MTTRTGPTAPRHGWELGPRYALWDGPMTPLTTMAAMPASTALAIGDVRMSVIGLDPDACSSGWAPPPPSISRSCPGFLCRSVSTWPSSFGSGATFPAALRHAPRLGPAASSRTPLALPATAYSAPLAPPERTGLAGRRVTLHRTASEPLDRSSPGRGSLVRIDQRNRCTLSGVAHRRVTRQAVPCAALLLRDGRMFVVYKGLSRVVYLNQYGTKLRMRCPEWAEPLCRETAAVLCIMAKSD